MSFYGSSIKKVLGLQGRCARIAGHEVRKTALLRSSTGAAGMRLFYSTETKQPAKEPAADADADEDEYYVDVSNLDKRWTSLAFEAQQDIISYLNVKQEFDWKYLSPDEKRAIYYIAYGKWGARDSTVMNASEFVFKLMTNMLLFSVLGFSMLNYAIDQEKIAELNKHDASEPSTP